MVEIYLECGRNIPRIRSSLSETLTGFSTCYSNLLIFMMALQSMGCGGLRKENENKNKKETSTTKFKEPIGCLLELKKIISLLKDFFEQKTFLNFTKTKTKQKNVKNWLRMKTCTDSG